MTIEQGIEKWRRKAIEARRIGRGVTVGPEWLLELMEWFERVNERGWIGTAGPNPALSERKGSADAPR